MSEGNDGLIPLVDLARTHHVISAELEQAFRDCLADSDFIMGERVSRFESEFAEYCGTTGSVGCSSGTSALHLALVGCGVEPGDEVITVAHTFVATAEAIVHCGATPVFVDIDPVSCTMDPGAFEAAITPATRAVIPVHLYGQLADMDAICAIAAKHGIRVVEDAAQAHGARDRQGRRAGAIGDAGCFSFYPGKNLGSLGDAGAVTTSNPAMAARMRMLANHGRTGKYLHEVVGYNYRIDAMQAAFLSVKLPYLDAWFAERQALAAVYDDLLEGVDVQCPQALRGHVYHLYVIELDQREERMRFLQERGIATGIHYPVPLHQQPCFGECNVSLPVTEAACKRILSLPLFPGMTGHEQERVVNAVREACEAS